MHAEEALDHVGWFLASEVACTAVVPFLGLRSVEVAKGVWAVGRDPFGLFVLSFHDLRHGNLEAKDKCLSTT